MNRYNNGKIYKLVNSVDSEIYIGSTCMPLAKRKSEHKKYSRQFSNRRVYEHLIRVGWDNVRIILIEEVQAQNKNQLLAREQHYIDLLNPSLNKISAVYSDCPHGRIKCYCKECGGNSICEHGKIKDKCKDCGGASICEHGKVKHRCKECDGNGICEHGRRKDRCRNCGGQIFCQHGKVKYICKDCIGDKYYCYECEKSFAGQKNLTRHCKSKTHKQTYIRMFKEVFEEDISESEVPIY